MAKIIDLQDLLRHEIMDLYSAEEQIIEALPKMAEKANNPELKKALQNHLRVTKEQKNRLDEVQRLMGNSSNEGGSESGEGGGERAGFFARLFGNATGSGGEKCKGTEGLIEEGEKMMAEDMTPEALDAAIIGSCQKIEHYEISGYGTARAFARELNLGEVATLLEQTLNEEYEADDQLTTLAVGKLNTKADMAQNDDDEDSSGGRSKSSSSKGGSRSSKGASKSSGGSKGGSKSSSKGSSKGGSKSSGGGSSSRGSSKSSGGSKSSKGSSKSSGGSKGGSKSSSKGSSKGGSKSSNRGGNKLGRGGSSKKLLRRR